MTVSFVPLLAVTGSLPSWLSFLTPIITGCEWGACAIGLCGAVISLGLAGAHWLQHRHDWGSLFLGVLGALAGCGFAGGAVAIGTALAATVTF
jgi:hypothetical protein